MSEQHVLLGMDCLRIALGMDPVNHEMRDVLRLLELRVQDRERRLAELSKPMQRPKQCNWPGCEGGHV